LVKIYGIKRTVNKNYHPTYTILNALELSSYFQYTENLKGAVVLVTQLGDKSLLINRSYFKKNSYYERIR